MSNTDVLAINTIRILAAEGVQKANSGHPGLPIGIRTYGVYAFFKALKA